MLINNTSAGPVPEDTGIVGTPPAPPSPASRIMYFITRTDGLPVPLIPADELPLSVKLQDIPRVLAPDQTYGLQYCGTSPYTGGVFKLESDSDTPLHTQEQPRSIQPLSSRTIPGAPQGRPRRGLLSFRDVVYPPVLPLTTSRAATDMSWLRTSPVSRAEEPINADSAQSLIDAISSTQSGAEIVPRVGHTGLSNVSPPPPSGVVPDQDKKEYCTYWILHGDCAYVQQGCRYKHEMPSRTKLSEIGINHVPRWWLEKSAPTKLDAGRYGVDRLRSKPVLVQGARKMEDWLGIPKSSESDESSTASEDWVEIEGDKRQATVGMKGDAKVERKLLTVPTTRASPPAEEARRPSYGGDLISFDALIPTPLRSASDDPLSSVCARPDVFPRSILNDPPASATGAIVPTKNLTKTIKVFVPAGEAVEKHISDVEKRERRERRARVISRWNPRSPRALATEKPSEAASVRSKKLTKYSPSVPIIPVNPSSNSEAVIGLKARDVRAKADTRSRRSASGADAAMGSVE